MGGEEGPEACTMPVATTTTPCRRPDKLLRRCTRTHLTACLVVIALEATFFSVVTWHGMQEDLSVVPLFGVGTGTVARTTTTRNRPPVSSPPPPSDVVVDGGSVERTIQVLISMGVHPDELADQADIPPWSQIVENFGTSDEPVILGLEHCQEYRDTTAFQDRAVAPAGMFSTGTNVFQALMADNCLSPDVGRRANPLYFNFHQAPVSFVRRVVLCVLLGAMMSSAPFFGF